MQEAENLPKSPLVPLQDFFENFAEAILITNDKSEPLLINTAFKKLTGYKQKNIALLIQSKLIGIQNDYTENREDKFASFETNLIKTDGTSVTLEVSLSRIALSNGAPGNVFTFCDITELKNAQVELAEQKKEWMRSNEELEQFAYVASHDMQEPLRMVTSYVQLMQSRIEQGNAEGSKEFMKHVTDGVARMQALITDLLEYSRVNSQGNLFADIELNEVVKIATMNLDSRISESKAELEIQNLPKIKGDSFQLIRLFQNLIDNAIKFRSAEKPLRIQISFEDKENHYLFAVADNGIGIEQKFYSRIFVIFQRLHTRKESEGTGIGLAVCKKIVERHGGEIWVESEPGKGSIFRFTMKK